MHLKSCPKLVRSELRLDASGVPMSQRSSLFMGQQAALLKTCGGNHGNTGSSRLPFSVISTNTLRRGNSTTHGVGALSLRLKTSPAALQPPPSPPGCENDDTFRLCPDADASLDIWTVIRPGHVREKIAIFALEAECTDGARGSERTSTGDSDRTNLGDTAGPFRAVKAKGSWAENCRAKRRRRSGNAQQDPRTRVQETPQTPRRSDGEAAEDEEQKVSVGEMVAFLEQRASEPDAKHLLVLQRSSTTIVLARAPPPEAKEAPEVKVEESDSVRVSDMVAKLESACLRKSDGELSRSNSLRRKVGRVLLASGDQSPAPCQPPSMTSSSSIDREPTSCSALATPASGEAAVQEAGGAEPPTEAPPPPVEPLPGLLFLTPASEPRLLRHRITLDLEPRPLLARRESDKRRAEEEECGVAVATAGRCASQDFLLMRQRLQRLLEPQQFLAILPHHVLLKILLLLPTQSLAALKCSCRYFRFVIDTYGVRPADSLWVSDPRYRDDPCKQCKRRYGRGDVSLCRWHHKPYCQALPYGPGYWMCCHGAHRDAPGCNVGLHDNRWVPAFHSINVPIYRRGRHDD